MLWLNSKEYCSKYKISNTTLKRWVDDGKIKCNKVSSRKFLYLDQNIEENKKLNVVYSRVSNTSQKEDLNRQIDLIKNYMIYNGYFVDLEDESDEKETERRKYQIEREKNSKMNYQNLTKIINKKLDNSDRSNSIS